MDSIGIYYTRRENQNPNKDTISTDLHINYIKGKAKKGKTKNGKAKKREGYNRVFDFGLKIIDDARKVDSIFFYFPFSVTEDNITDLGDVCSNHEFLSTLFNETYTVSNDSNNNYYRAEPLSSEKTTFYLYKLGKENFEIKKLHADHTLLQIKIKSLPKQTGIGAKDNDKLSIYFRFRLKNFPVDKFIHIENLSNNFLQSAFSKVEMLDFGINQIRKMSAKVQEELTSDNRIPLRFKKIHFHFIGSSDDEQIDGSVHYRECALLDKERWGNYLNDIEIDKHQCISYHWCVKADEDKTLLGFNMFFRTTYKDLSVGTLTVYALIMIAFSFVAGWLIEGIKALFN